MITDKQKSAVSLCEEMLDVTFSGDLENEEQVNEFLCTYLQDALIMYDELSCEYEAYRMEHY